MLAGDRRGRLALSLSHWRCLALLARSRWALVRAVLLEWWWLARTERAEGAAELASAVLVRIDSEDPELLMLGKELAELRSSGASQQDFARSIDQHLGRLKSRICGQVDSGLQPQQAGNEASHMTARTGAISD